MLAQQTKVLCTINVLFGELCEKVSLISDALFFPMKLNLLPSCPMYTPTTPILITSSQPYLDPSHIL